MDFRPIDMYIVQHCRGGGGWRRCIKQIAHMIINGTCVRVVLQTVGSYDLDGHVMSLEINCRFRTKFIQSIDEYTSILPLNISINLKLFV